MKESKARACQELRQAICIGDGVGRAPTRSESFDDWEGRGPMIGEADCSHLPLRGKLGWMTAVFVSMHPRNVNH